MAEIIIKTVTDTDSDRLRIKTSISGTGEELSIMIAHLICQQAKTNGFDYRMLLKLIEKLCEEISNVI